MTRRFIAGARCPQCGQLDKIVVDSSAGIRECVNCGFADERPLEGAVEPRTRVTRPAARRQDTPAEVVTLVPGPDSLPPNTPDGKTRDQGE